MQTFPNNLYVFHVVQFSFNFDFFYIIKRLLYATKTRYETTLLELVALKLTLIVMQASR